MTFYKRIFLYYIVLFCVIYCYRVQTVDASKVVSSAGRRLIRGTAASPLNTVDRQTAAATSTTAITTTITTATRY